MRIIIAIVIGLMMFNALGMAQTPFQAGVNFIAGFPQGEFRENVNNPGGGLSGNFAYQIPGTPLALGAGLGFLIYGSESRLERLSPNIPDIVVTVETTNNILIGHLLARIQPISKNAVAQPYLEGLIGFHYLWTETRLKGSGWDGYSDITSTNYDDAAISYGGGAGIMFRVYQGQKKDSNGIYSIYIDLGMHYLIGGEATYLKQGDIRREYNEVIYSPSKSTTDLLKVGLGVSFAF